MVSKPSQIKGKWNGRVYKVKKELGRGANGIVYLVEYAGRPYALKVGRDSFSLTSEVNALKQVSGAQGEILGPSLYDVDDWEAGGEVRPFYVMNVMEGTPLVTFIQQRGKEWLPVLVAQLLHFLEQLHQRGWVFGDLKPEHILVTGRPPRLAWYDAGGMTRIGRAIKEYTELYDRGVWQQGDRKAEPRYDLFSLALIILHCARGQPLHPGPIAEKTLEEGLRECAALAPYRPVLKAALSGQFRSALEMRTAWLSVWAKPQERAVHWKKGERQPRSGTARSVHKGGRAQQAAAPGKKKSLLRRLGQAIAVLFLSSFLFVLLALYLFYQAL